jgi:hypothetical protein
MCVYVCVRERAGGCSEGAAPCESLPRREDFTVKQIMEVCVYMCVCIYIYIYTHSHIYIHTYTCTAQVLRSAYPSWEVGEKRVRPVLTYLRKISGQNANNKSASDRSNNIACNMGKAFVAGTKSDPRQWVAGRCVLVCFMNADRCMYVCVCVCCC